MAGDRTGENLVARNEMHCSSLAVSRAALVASRHVRHPLTIQVNFADAFYPREHVINGLAAKPHQFGADDPRHEITGQIENFLRRGPVEPLAKNCCHRASEGLHFGTKRHSDMRPAILVHVQINADGVGAFLVFPNVDQSEIFALPRLLSLGIVCIRNQRLSPLIFGKRVKEFDDLVQIAGIHRAQSLPAI